jgi:hypothetical protein
MPLSGKGYFLNNLFTHTKEKYSVEMSLQERRQEKYMVVDRRIMDMYMVATSDHTLWEVERKQYVIVH